MILAATLRDGDNSSNLKPYSSIKPLPSNSEFAAGALVCSRCSIEGSLFRYVQEYGTSVLVFSAARSTRAQFTDFYTSNLP